MQAWHAGLLSRNSWETEKLIVGKNELLLTIRFYKPNTLNIMTFSPLVSGFPLLCFTIPDWSALHWWKKCMTPSIRRWVALTKSIHLNVFYVNLVKLIYVNLKNYLSEICIYLVLKDLIAFIFWHLIWDYFMSGRHCWGVESVMRSKSRGFIYSYFIFSMDRL